MSLSFIIVRTILGLTFTLLGFLLSRSFYFNSHPLLSLPYFGETLAGFLGGVLGALVVPYLAAAIQKWFVSLIQVTVQTTVARAMGSFFAAQKHKLAEIRSQKQPGRRPAAAKYQTLSPPVLLDTSAIIDGRIFDVAKTGFLETIFILPYFILEELQKIADSHEELKRQRGRRGLELLDEARKEKRMKIIIWKEKVAGSDVDQKLSSLAKKVKGKIATVDYNLNKTASVLGLTVLNVNDLTNVVKSVVLPGETLKIRVVQRGKEAGQGVGYLEDGTMVVVEDGADALDTEIEVKVARLLQTSAGKMIFARPL